jgi:hypothetical protein
MGLATDPNEASTLCLRSHAERRRRSYANRDPLVRETVALAIYPYDRIP